MDNIMPKEFYTNKLAPEIILKNRIATKITTKSNLWSAAIVVIEFADPNAKFLEDKDMVKYYISKYASGSHFEIYERPDKISEEFFDIIKENWNVPHKRPIASKTIENIENFRFYDFK